MLADFIDSHREEILECTRARVSARTFRPTDAALPDGIPAFLHQVCQALRTARMDEPGDRGALRESAERHGHALLRVGLTVGQVVQCYGDVSQVLAELTAAAGDSISLFEFRMLTLCLDEATANAVSAYARGRDVVTKRQETESLGVLAHELRNVLNAAMMAYDIVRAGQVTITGSTGQVLGRSLLALRDLIDRSLASVRLDAGIDYVQPIVVAELLEEIEVGARLQAEARGVRFRVVPVDSSVSIEADRQIVAAALSNLLQNAFKFTRKGSLVSLTTGATSARVLFDVEDECGGLPPGKAEGLFYAFEQQGDDRSGVGLGLSICKKAALASDGKLEVHDLPGKGCVFTLDLPRVRSSPAPAER